MLKISAFYSGVPPPGASQYPMRKLRNGMRKLRNGMRKLRNGMRKLRNGMRKLRNGMRKLRNGMRKLRNYLYICISLFHHQHYNLGIIRKKASTNRGFFLQ